MTVSFDSMRWGDVFCAPVHSSRRTSVANISNFNEKYNHTYTYIVRSVEFFRSDYDSLPVCGILRVKLHNYKMRLEFTLRDAKRVFFRNHFIVSVGKIQRNGQNKKCVQRKDTLGEIITLLKNNESFEPTVI